MNSQQISLAFKSLLGEKAELGVIRECSSLLERLISEEHEVVKRIDQQELSRVTRKPVAQLLYPLGTQELASHPSAEPPSEIPLHISVTKKRPPLTSYEGCVRLAPMIVTFVIPWRGNGLKR